MASDQDDNKGKQEKGHLFDDISAAQVIATALAAVTSMLLASYIGIAGSVIGVAVASIVSTLAASAYKKFLRDSADKIKEIPLPAIREGKTISLGEAIASKEQRGKEAESHDPGTGGSAEDNQQQDGEAPDRSAEESADPSLNELKSGHETEKLESVSGVKGESKKRPVPQRKVMRGLIAVCIVSALLAVAASGAVVYLLTTGNGLGTKPQIVYVNTPADTSDGGRGESVHSSGSSAGASNSGSDQPSSEKSKSDQSGQSDQNGTDGTQSNPDSTDTSASSSEASGDAESTSPSGSGMGSSSGSNASGSNAAANPGSSAGSKPSDTSST